jgi:NitT/TauT family transport system substrate-binding protein
MRLSGRPLLALCLAVIAVAAPAARADTLSVSEYGKITSTLPWAVAFKKGFLHQDGLNITDLVSSSGGGTGLRNMMASNLGIGVMGTTTAIAAINQGMDLRIVGCNADDISDLTWATLKDSKARSIKDLAGQKIAYTSPRSTTEMILRVAVAKAGMTGKVEILPIGGLGPGLTALAQGAVAATPLVDPTLTLQADRYRVLFQGRQVIPKFTYSLIVATRQFTQQHPDQVRALLRAHRHAVEYMEQHHDEAAQIYSQVFGAKLDDAKKLLEKYYGWGQFSHGDFSKQGLEAMSDGMQLVGIVKKPVDWSKILDQSFLAPDQQRKLW